MTDQELQGLAAQGLKTVKTEMEMRGRDARNWLIGAYHHGEGLQRYTKVEDLIVERLGKNWLDDSGKKELAFEMLKLCVITLPPDAVVIVTATNRFRPTEAFSKLDKKRRRAIIGAGHQRHHQAVTEGLFEVEEVLWSTAQTPDRLCSYTQLVVNGVFQAPPKLSFSNQTQFGGRLKMFGEGQ